MNILYIFGYIARADPSMDLRAAWRLCQKTGTAHLADRVILGFGRLSLYLAPLSGLATAYHRAQFQAWNTLV